MYLKKNSKIFVAGHKGMVGSAILNYLKKKKYSNIITVEKNFLNLLDQNKTYKFLKQNKPEYVIIAAGRVGGILANKKLKANFIYENIMIQTNLIHGSYLAGVKNLIFLGSSCIYPKFSKQPIKEEYLLSSKLEETNDAYAIAKIAGVKMCEAYNTQYGLKYLCLMPSNLYGPGDNYDSNSSHFYPAIIKKIYEAIKRKKKQIIIWGNGNPRRELTFVDDVAQACEFFFKINCNHSLINIGTGKDKKINDYCKFLMKKLNCDLKIKYDKSKPNGTPRKLLDISLAKSYGWKPQYSLEDGLKLTIKDFLKKNFKLL